MSLKAEIETWASALDLYDKQDFASSLEEFEKVAESSKILFNIALIHATQGEHEIAVDNFRQATERDPYMAVAYFQCGVSNFLIGNYEEATRDFEDAETYMRGNLTIDYEQIGLKFRLYSCEIFFNKGLSQIYTGNSTDGFRNLQRASTEKQTAEHSVIDEAIRDEGEGYTVFSIPVGVLFRPSENKLKNVGTKNYLGTAKLVAATSEADAFIGFTGSTRAARERLGPISAGPNATLPDSGAGLSRSRTTAARFQQSDGDSSGDAMTALRRRPTDTTASITLSSNQLERIAPRPKFPQRSASMKADISTRIAERSTRSPARSPNPYVETIKEEVESRFASQFPQGAPETPYLDGLIDNYGASTTKVPPLRPRAELRQPEDQPPERVADWAKNNADPWIGLGSSSASPGGSVSLSRKPSSAALSRKPSSAGISPKVHGNQNGGGLVRSTSRNYASPSGSVRGGGGRKYEEEEGYGTDDNRTASARSQELVRIRLKLHYADDVRGMSISPLMEFLEFHSRLETKFERAAESFRMKYKDSDGSMVSIVDESDWDSAIDCARENAGGKPDGKLEIWLTNR